MSYLISKKKKSLTTLEILKFTCSEKGTNMYDEISKLFDAILCNIIGILFPKLFSPTVIKKILAIEKNI